MTTRSPGDNSTNKITNPDEGCNQLFILWLFPPSLPYLSFLSFSLPPFPSPFPRLEVAPEIQVRDWRSSVSSPSGQNDIFNHQTRFLGSKYTANSRPRTHLRCILELRKRVSGCKCRPISFKRNLTLGANVVVSVYTACYRVVAY